MKLILLLTSLFCLSVRADVVSLFDGKTLDGWEGDKKFWSVEDGAITGKSTVDNPCKKSTYLILKGREFANFELTVSYRFLTEKGNSGVQYRSKRKNKETYQIMGYQADMEAGQNYSGILYEQDGRGIVAKRGEQVKISNEGKKVIQPEPITEGEKAQESLNNAEKGKWHTYRVVADGHTLTHEINGFKTIEVEDNDVNRRAAKGLLALQMHQGPPMTIQYKDINILELPDSPAPKVEKKDTSKLTPEWIWGEKTSDGQILSFEKEFELKQLPKQSMLAVSADNSCFVWINGKMTAKGIDWADPIQEDVAKHLKLGKNTIRVQAKNDTGLAGMLLELSDLTVSDTSWKCLDESKNSLKTISLGKYGVQPWGKVFKQIIEEEVNLTVIDGFKVEKIYSVNKNQEGSWVAMCFDDKGALYVGDQYGYVFKLTLENGKVISKKKIENVKHVQGLVWAFGSLYVSSDLKEKSGVIRLTDTNNDGTFDKTEHIFHALGAGEHGPHSLIVSPDGKGLYYIVGNFTNIDKSVKSISNNNWAEDTLHPHLPDGMGHASHVKVPAGKLISLSPDGKQVKIIAMGMRNTFDIAKSPSGDVFGYDADMEYDIGTPWYRPTRVMHFIDGAEYGWRTGTAKWPEYYADSLGSVIDIGPGSPTGIVFGTGAKFPAKYQQALFINDWTFGRIYAVHLQPDGVSYKATKETFVSGKPLPLTDISIGPDGNMYFLTGGRRLGSALYRVSYVGNEPTPALATRSATDAQKKLSSIQESRDPKTLWKALGSKDRTLRFAARVSLETLDIHSWLDLWKEETDAQTVITASLAFSRVISETKLYIMNDLKLLQLDFSSMDESLKLEYLRAIGLAGIRTGKPDSETRAKFLAKLQPHYPNTSAVLNRELCRLLVYLESPQVLNKTIFLMKSSVAVRNNISDDLLDGNDNYGKDFRNMQEKQPDSQALHYALMLKNQKSGWAEQSVRDYYGWIAAAKTRSGGKSYIRFLENIAKEAMTHLSPELKQLAEDAVKVPPKEIVSHTAEGPGQSWTMASALKASEDLTKANIENGKKMFQAVLCARCHMHSGVGGGAGPELTNLATRFSKEDILKAITDPSEVISEQYETTVFTLKDKSSVEGRLIEDDGKHLHIATNPFDFSMLTKIVKSSVLKSAPSKVSTMPPSLINALNPDELRDLMLYLTTQPK